MGGRWRGIPVVILMVAVLAACGAVPGTGTPLPTFPPPSPTSAPAGQGPNDKGLIPDDCARILPTDVLEAVLGLPLDSVGVHTTVHLPSPTVGRTERVACRYTRTDGSAKDREVLLLDVSAYRDADAATAQWRVNVDAENAQGRDIPLGSARAVLVERTEESVLMVVNALANFYFVLPQGASLANRTVADTLVDLALRVLPVVPAAAEPVAGTQG